MKMVLILAYGNNLRRDDGAGFVLADSLEKLFFEAGVDVKRIDSHQLGPELALEIAGNDVASVLFVDTRAVEDAPDHPSIDIKPAIAAQSSSPTIGHHLDESVLLSYVRHLFNKEPPAWLITVPGVDFGVGEGLSDTCLRAIENSGKELDLFVGEIIRKRLPTD